MKEVLQVAYLRHLQDFYLFESVKDGYTYTTRLLRKRNKDNKCSIRYMNRRR